MPGHGQENYWSVENNFWLKTPLLLATAEIVLVQRRTKTIGQHKTSWLAVNPFQLATAGRFWSAG